MNIDCLIDFRKIGVKIEKKDGSCTNPYIRLDGKPIKIGSFRGKRYIKLRNQNIEVKRITQISHIGELMLVIKTVDKLYYLLKVIPTEQLCEEYIDVTVIRCENMNDIILDIDKNEMPKGYNLDWATDGRSLVDGYATFWQMLEYAMGIRKTKVRL